MKPGVKPGEVKERIALAEQELAALVAELERTPAGAHRSDLNDRITQLRSRISMLKATLLSEASPLDILAGLRQQEARVVALQARVRAARASSERTKLQGALQDSVRALTEAVVAARARLSTPFSSASYPDGIPPGETPEETVEVSSDSTGSSDSNGSEDEADPVLSTEGGQPEVVSWPVSELPSKPTFSPYFLLVLSGLGTWLFFTRTRN